MAPGDRQPLRARCRRGLLHGPRPTPASSSLLSLASPRSVTLRTDARFATPPGKAPPAGTFGGGVSFTVTRVGIYRIALGAPAWIDVTANGANLPSAAHVHCEPCTRIVKIVDYMLQPGRHVLQPSGAYAESVKVMVARTG